MGIPLEIKKYAAGWQLNVKRAFQRKGLEAEPGDYLDFDVIKIQGVTVGVLIPRYHKLTDSVLLSEVKKELEEGERKLINRRS